MHIGRIFYQGIVTVGDVTAFKSRKGNVQLWFPFKKVEHAANFYEVLIYTVNDIDPRMSADESF
ncbi:hypothetical protein BDFB_011384 [Asbolus verrucosus]|uniref:Uncharacterized protein n=1 Tax=Asbolus verrucosus TaxID=1661398 RepID=A0A482VAD0_ASBVE|nr:hypothetical protein BDFB_011384 [Asbolus verrucosus]